MNMMNCRPAFAQSMLKTRVVDGGVAQPVGGVAEAGPAPEPGEPVAQLGQVWEWR